MLEAQQKKEEAKALGQKIEEARRRLREKGATARPDEKTPPPATNKALSAGPAEAEFGATVAYNPLNPARAPSP